MRLQVVTFLAGISLAGCRSNSRIDRLEKQNQELLAQLHRQDAAHVYDLEAKCAEEAKDLFADRWHSDATTAVLSYTSHYNRAVNKCFMQVKHMTYMDKDDHFESDESLMDVHEGRELGSFYDGHGTVAGTDYIECKIAGSVCSSQEAFEAAVKRYMSN